MNNNFQSQIDFLQKNNKHIHYLINTTNNKSYTFQDLFIKSAIIYSHIKKYKNIKHIAFMLKNADNYMPCLIACWQHGCSAIILDPATPYIKYSNLNESINFDCIFTDHNLAIEFSTFQILAINKLEYSETENKNTAIKLKITNNTPAIILFSSGTTGESKQIPLSLCNLWSNIKQFSTVMKIDHNDTFLCTSPLYYAHGLYNSLLTCFVLGCKMIYGAPLSLFNTQQILTVAQQHQASIYHITPSMASVLTVLCSRVNVILPQFKYIICGTAQIKAPLKKEIETIFKTSLLQQYGMTETLIMSINKNKSKEKANSLGIPYFCELQIVDDDGVPLPTNEEGNIIVQSPACFGSYYQQKHESSLAFNKGWFNTGDIGFLDKDNYLTLTGRKKNLIKKGGININPEEINDVLCRFPTIKEAATVGIEDDIYGEDIYSFIEVIGDTIDMNQLNKHCKKYLTSTHIPKKITVLADFPKSNSGKILTHQLKKIFSCKTF